MCSQALGKKEPYPLPLYLNTLSLQSDSVIIIKHFAIREKQMLIYIKHKYEKKEIIRKFHRKRIKREIFVESRKNESRNLSKLNRQPIRSSRRQMALNVKVVAPKTEKIVFKVKNKNDVYTHFSRLSMITFE